MMGINKIDGNKIPEEPILEKEKILEKKVPSTFDKLLEKREKYGKDNDRVKSDEREKRVKNSKHGKEKKKIKKDSDELLKMAYIKMRTFEKKGTSIESKKSIGFDTKVLVDEIVSKMRVGLNRSGNAEVQIDLKSEVLEGLKITLTVTKEGVIASFEAANMRVLNGLSEHISDLRNGLLEKGINVSDLKLFLKEEENREREEERERRQREWKGDADE